MPETGPCEDLTELSATAAVAAMTRGDFSAERYAATLLARCAAQRNLNAFITLEPERVLEAARECDRRRSRGLLLGPLHGLPIPVKDSINTRHYPTTSGTPALRHFRPTEDAPIVATLVAAGAIVLGKTNLHELSFGWTSNNRAFGPVRNPYDPARIAGGSSGGSAAAVAARMAPLALAADTEGSIRVPAALCGIAGFRPTTARYPNSGIMPISACFDQVGPVARCVADLQLFDRVASGEGSTGPVALDGVRLAVGREYWFADLHPEVERLAALALRRLEAAGAELIEVALPDLARLISLTTSPIQSHDFRPSVAAYLERHRAGVGVDEVLAAASPDVRRVLADFASPGGAHYASASAYREACDLHLPQLRAALRQLFADSGAHAIVFPATLVPAPPIGEGRSVMVRGASVPFSTAIARNIGPGSTAGLPGLVLPVGLTAAGLPVAMEFDAPPGQDLRLLGLGMSLEATLGPVPPPARS
jgi:mandelamide amidase